MIARLTGILVECGADHAVIDVAGVGYHVLAGSRTLGTIGPIGGTVMVFTEMHVREDAMIIFAFASARERDWFRMLTGVQGVGGKVALAILSTLDPDEISQAIAGGNNAMVARANGVGPKLAQRIVMELKDKVGGIALANLGSFAPPKTTIAADAVSALTNLGFRPNIAHSAVAAAEIELGDAVELDGLVRLALKKAAT